MTKILYVDMDGVLADFEQGVKLIHPEIKWEEGEVDLICEKHPDIFKHLPEIEGGIAAVKELIDDFDIYFLSTPMCHVHESYTGKRTWIHHKFGDWADRRLILTHRKDLCIGDFLVDDRLKNGASLFKGEHIHFGTEKFLDWDKTLQYLKTKI